MSMKPINSVVTMPAKAVDSQTSNSLIEAGVAAPLSGEQRKAGVTRLLQVKDPAKVDKNLVTSLESYLGFPIRQISRTVFKESSVDIIVKGYEITTKDMDGLNRAIVATQMALSPFSNDEVEKQLAVVATLLVKPAGENAQDQTIRIKSLAMKLSEFPADIVTYALDRVVERSTFWPSYAEIYKHIEWRVKNRNMLLDALLKKRIDLTAQLQ